MKNYPIILSFVLLLSACAGNRDYKAIVQERMAQSYLNFIPDSAGTTPSYWCTWSAQNFGVDTFTLQHVIGLGDHTVPSDNLTEDVVFRNPGWEKMMPEEIKKDLYITFDVGWDIAGGSHQDKATKWIIGTHEVASDKFPSCTGTPEERLRKLNEMTKAAGWKGAAIWVAAQTSMDSKGKKPSGKDVENYFRERFRWSKAAGIEYWKVDYGARGGDIDFRKMLTRLAHEEASGLWVEHGRGSGPFNDDECPWDDPNPGKTGKYKNWEQGNALRHAYNLLQFSDVLRTYDVSAQLSVPTTLDRVAQILGSFSESPQGKGIINCEDEPYLAAALGCAIGVMRHPSFIEANGHDYDPLDTKKQMDAIVRAVRWQRLSPAFGVGSVPVVLDTVYHTDYWNFKPGQTWAKWMNGKTVLQAAPARVARGMELPEVKGDTLPYVLSSRFSNGTYAVATLFRTDSVKGFVKPLADVTLRCEKPAMVAVFGIYKTLTLQFESMNGMKQIYAQDLAGNKAIDVTDLVKINNHSVTLDGVLLKSVGTSAATKNDVSEPGVLLVFK